MMPMPTDMQRRMKSAFGGFCATVVRPVIDVDKVVWNNVIRRNSLYYKGFQHLAYDNAGGGLIDYTPVSGSPYMGVRAGNNQNEDDSLYDYVLNVLQGDVDTFVAVFGGRAPNTQSQARDLQNEAAMRLRMKADRVNAYLDSHLSMINLQTELARCLALYGTTFGLSQFTVNPDKWGITHHQNYEPTMLPMGPANYHCPYCGAVTEANQAQSLLAQSPEMSMGAVPCRQCGRPLGPESLIQPEMMPTMIPTSTTPFANGAIEFSLLTAASITVPLRVKDMLKVPWAVKEEEEDKGAIVRAYPELRDRVYHEGGYMVSGDVLGRWTRNMMKSPSGYLLSNERTQWLTTTLWITPAAIEYIPNDQKGDLREYLLSTYPDGMRIPMVNGEALVGGLGPNKDSPCRVMNSRLNGELTACRPKPGDGIYVDPYFECMIQGADIVNDSVNLVVELAARSNPFIIADPEVIDPETVSDFVNYPGDIRFSKPGMGGRLDKAIFRAPATILDPTMISFIDKYIAWCREITGIVPALFGGSSGSGDQTAYEADLKHNQAMMKLSPTWTEMRTFWAQNKDNMINLCAKYSNGKLYSSNPQGIVQSQDLEGIDELLQGGWYMETEESMPQSIGQRRNWVMSVLRMPPEVQNGVFGVNKPNNIEKIQETVGMADWIVPGYDQVLRMTDIIYKLLQMQPIPGQPDPMTGQMSPDQPSMPFNQFLFDASLALDVLKTWLLSDKGSSLEGTPGYANVMAYAQSVANTMPPPPAKDPAKISVSINIRDLTPEAQQAIFSEAGIMVPPGAMIAYPPEPKNPSMITGQNPQTPPSEAQAPPPTLGPGEIPLPHLHSHIGGVIQ